MASMEPRQPAVGFFLSRPARRWMMATSRVRIVLLTVFVVLLPVGALLALPPWHNRYSCLVHHWLWNATGIQLHNLDHHTGTVRLWDSQGRLRTRYELDNGLRHGRWVEYDEAGLVKSECEYRNGEPWDGICYIVDGKAWVGHYKDGRPWNGCLPVYDKAEGRSAWKCYVDGASVSDEEFRRHHNLDPRADLVGLHHWQRSQATPPAN
jgi:hypothetical protein